MKNINKIGMVFLMILINVTTSSVMFAFSIGASIVSSIVGTVNLMKYMSTLKESESS